jgi:hypothetical protein
MIINTIPFATYMPFYRSQSPMGPSIKKTIPVDKSPGIKVTPCSNASLGTNVDISA